MGDHAKGAGNAAPVNTKGKPMIPQSIAADTATGAPSMEVWAFVSPEVPNSVYHAGIAVVTQPGTGRWATVRAVTHDGLNWAEEPGTFELGYAGYRDAQRHMYARASLDNHGTVPVSVAGSHVFGSRHDG